MSDVEERLSRYFDGELGAEGATDVERLLADSPESRALLRDFEEVGAALRAMADEQGARGDAIADHVMASIEDVGAGRSPERRSAGSTARGRVIPFAPVIGAALAAAAAVALLLRSHPPQPIVRAADSSLAALAVAVPSQVPEASESAAPAEMAALAGQDDDTGASIESVDFGAQNGSIFMVASGPQVTPVVWLVDEPAPSGGRMTPL